MSLRVPTIESGSSSGSGGGAVGAVELDLEVPLMDGEEVSMDGMVIGGTSNSSNTSETSLLSHISKLNIVLALISCYVAIILTGWGSIILM